VAAVEDHVVSPALGWVVAASSLDANGGSVAGEVMAPLAGSAVGWSSVGASLPAGACLPWRACLFFLQRVAGVVVRCAARG